MGTTNYGNQDLSFDFKEPGKSENFNKLNYKLFPSGIYSGGLLTRVSNSSVTIAPLVCYMDDDTSEVGVRIKTATVVTKEVSSAYPYLILRFSWLNLENNFMDIESVAYSGILTGDLVIGRCVYDGGSLISFDYTRRTDPILSSLKSDNDELNALPKEPYSDVVRILAGTIYTFEGIVSVSEQDSPAISNTGAQGRIDLVHIDDSGDAKIEEGTPGASPVAPDHSIMRVVAEISRGANSTYITGSDITRVYTDKRSEAFTSYIKTLMDDENASEAQTTLGISAYIKTLIDDADSIAARATLDAEKTITVDTNAPGGGDGVNGDFWFVRES